MAQTTKSIDELFESETRYGDIISAVRGNIERAKKIGRPSCFSFNGIDLEVSPGSQLSDICRIFDLKNELRAIRR